ncbi:hypothetical protein BDV59DRAFT_180123 [Aspergillus ambiguus]|uniref:putative C2H2 finger domain protein n=1 Tax=Aspergillus ambiguus TaxID=176160 RepID=UPI003CCD161F
MHSFDSYTPPPMSYLSYEEDSLPLQDDTYAHHAAVGLRVAEVQRQLAAEGAIKVSGAPSPGPWAMDMQMVAPTSAPGLSPFDSDSGADSPQTIHDGWSYPSPRYLTPPYDDHMNMLSQSNSWGCPSPAIDLDPPVIPPHAVQQYPEIDPIFEPAPGISAPNRTTSLPSSAQTPPSPPTAPQKRPSSNRVSKGLHKRSQPNPQPSPAVRRTSTSKDSSTQRQRATASARLFLCSFRRYGCPSTFTSKNEWKRHVATKHIQLGFYRCDMEACLSESSRVGGTRQGKLFNRKDLFTQHHRRMHAPWSGRHPKQPSSVQEREAFERSMDGVRDRCWHELRKLPDRSTCGFCGKRFLGPHSWDARMEHVGRHFEKDLCVDEAEDVHLREWALAEGIIHPASGGRFELVKK